MTAGAARSMEQGGRGGGVGGSPLNSNRCAGGRPPRLQRCATELKDDTMTPFAVAGIQMLLHHGSNIEAMRHRLDLTMQLYPWVQMVMFSELACFGPLLH